jgi:hypothetical protein
LVSALGRPTVETGPNGRSRRRGGRSVVNLTDEDPPQFGTSPGATSLSTYDLIGRHYYVSLAAKF